jgi:hypothetical protein
MDRHFSPFRGKMWGFVIFPVIVLGKPKFHVKDLVTVMLVVWAVQSEEIPTHSQNIISPFSPLKEVVEEIEAQKVDPNQLK